MEKLTQSELKKRIRYDPDTGEFTWIGKCRSCLIGRVAGCLDGEGYRCIQINRTRYMAHRLVFLYVHGQLPDRQVDHINGVRDDNRIENLRIVSQGENLRNSSRSIANTSGKTGVCWCKRSERWVVHIGVDGSLKRLGSSTNFEEAVRLREEGEDRYGYHKNHGRDPIRTTKQSA
ncbi:hypothetical protein CFI10_11295 [Marinobacterium iners]|uniref:HNH endonuclease signature motif containing protein n=1 Tax=Marinobacterium iners TaxID=48076 RepID=UPI001A8EB732|nr:hypothetical protein CFI10_11295 [Marinobacterium iners]